MGRLVLWENVVGDEESVCYTQTINFMVEAPILSILSILPVSQG